MVALVNGVTAAGGLELLLQLRLRHRQPRSAKIGDAHLNFGQMGGGGALTLLPRAIGRATRGGAACSPVASSTRPRPSSGDSSTACVDDDALLAAGTDWSTGFATKSPLAMANAKDVMMSLWADNGSVDAGLRFERERNSYYCLTSDDAVEGLAAFAEKRPPEFRGS